MPRVCLKHNRQGTTVFCPSCLEELREQEHFIAKKQTFEDFNKMVDRVIPLFTYKNFHTPRMLGWKFLRQYILNKQEEIRIEGKKNEKIQKKIYSN